MAELTVINEHFAIPGQLHFKEGPGGLPVAEISNRHATASICLQGGQVLSWVPDGHKPVIWMSEQASFAPAKSIRGGIPVCWPWFGPHPEHESYPAHGVARNSPWEVIHTEELDNGSTRLGLMLVQSELIEDYWPQPTELHLNIDVGRELKLELITRNNGTSPITISEALHTYFVISDIEKIAVQGLENHDYVDKVDGGTSKHQQHVVTISGETDRVYLDAGGTCQINDPGLGRRILIGKSGSRSTIVWNPGAEKSAAMADMGQAAYRTMVCVESGNALVNSVTLEAGAEHHMAVDYRVDTFM